MALTLRIATLRNQTNTPIKLVRLVVSILARITTYLWFCHTVTSIYL